MSEHVFYNIDEPPKLSDWSCVFCGVRYIPKAGDEPNWFWRWTQYLVFGFRWQKRVVRTINPYGEGDPAEIEGT